MTAHLEVGANWRERMFDVADTAGDAVVDTMEAGHVRYPDERWSTQSVYDHLDHAHTHLHAYRMGDVSEPHLKHSLTRIAMALTLLGES